MSRKYCDSRPKSIGEWMRGAPTGPETHKTKLERSSAPWVDSQPMQGRAHCPAWSPNGALLHQSAAQRDEEWSRALRRSAEHQGWPRCLATRATQNGRQVPLRKRQSAGLKFLHNVEAMRTPATSAH